MQLLYNSDSFAVVRFDVPAADDVTADSAANEASRAAGTAGTSAPARGGYEIVDKFAKKGIFIDGALARRFREGVEALAEQGPSEEDIDEFIAGYTQLAQQPLTVH